MAFTSVARTYANVNRDAPKSYWDYGTKPPHQANKLIMQIVYK